MIPQMTKTGFDQHRKRVSTQNVQNEPLFEKTGKTQYKIHVFT